MNTIDPHTMNALIGVVLTPVLAWIIYVIDRLTTYDLNGEENV